MKRLEIGGKTMVRPYLGVGFDCNAQKIPSKFYNNFIICLVYKSSQMGIFQELINDKMKMLNVI